MRYEADVNTAEQPEYAADSELSLTRVRVYWGAAIIDFYTDPTKHIKLHRLPISYKTFCFYFDLNFIS